MSLTTLPFPVDKAAAPAIEVQPRTHRKISTRLVGKIQTVLEQAIDVHPEFENILISTADGFDIAAMIKDNDKESIRRLAAISSSMLSLSIELLAEMSAGELKILTLEGEQGNIFITQVSADTFALSLTVITRDKESLGKFFWLIRQLRQEIETLCAGAVQVEPASEGSNGE